MTISARLTIAGLAGLPEGDGNRYELVVSVYQHLKGEEAGAGTPTPEGVTTII